MLPHSPQSEPAPRRIALHHAEIRTDSTHLRRTAQFTDGSTRVVALPWAAVTRVAVFRRDVQTAAVLALAVTDPANVVVLDEHMEGWSDFIEHLPAHLTLATSFAEWRSKTPADPLSSHWSILFRA